MVPSMKLVFKQILWNQFELVHPSWNSFLVASLTNLNHRQKLVTTDQRLHKSTSKRLSKKKQNIKKQQKLTIKENWPQKIHSIIEINFKRPSCVVQAIIEIMIQFVFFGQ